MSITKNGNRNEDAKHSNIIIVEGSSDKLVIEELLAEKGLSNVIDVREYGGLDKIHAQLLPLVNSARKENPFAAIHLLVVWDRDQPHNATSNTSKEKICKELFLNANKRLAHLGIETADKFNSPVLASLYEMPGEGIEGEELEDLWLKTLDKDATKCIDAYFECIKFKPAESKGKRYAQIYLAGRQYYFSAINKLSKKPEDLKAILKPSHPVYQPLIIHIEQFFNVNLAQQLH